METNIFEVASRKKLTFVHPEKGGQVRVDDLWSLSLTLLNQMYQELRRIERNAVTDSLLDTPTTKDSENKLRIDIITHIVGVKKAEQDARELRAANEAKRQKILALYERKQDEKLEQMSSEDLQKLLESL